MVHQEGRATTVMASSDTGNIEKPAKVGNAVVVGPASNSALHTPETCTTHPRSSSAIASSESVERSAFTLYPSLSTRMVLLMRMFSPEFAIVPDTDIISRMPDAADTSGFLACLKSSFIFVGSAFVAAAGRPFPFGQNSASENWSPPKSRVTNPAAVTAVPRAGTEAPRRGMALRSRPSCSSTKQKPRPSATRTPSVFALCKRAPSSDFITNASAPKSLCRSARILSGPGGGLMVSTAFSPAAMRYGPEKRRHRCCLCIRPETLTSASVSAMIDSSGCSWSVSAT